MNQIHQLQLGLPFAVELVLQVTILTQEHLIHFSHWIHSNLLVYHLGGVSLYKGVTALAQMKV